VKLYTEFDALPTAYSLQKQLWRRPAALWKHLQLQRRDLYVSRPNTKGLRIHMPGRISTGKRTLQRVDGYVVVLRHDTCAPVCLSYLTCMPFCAMNRAWNSKNLELEVYLGMTWQRSSSAELCELLCHNIQLVCLCTCLYVSVE
jgi:hypothetical protein